MNEAGTQFIFGGGGGGGGGAGAGAGASAGGGGGEQRREINNIPAWMDKYKKPF